MATSTPTSPGDAGVHSDSGGAAGAGRQIRLPEGTNGQGGIEGRRQLAVAFDAMPVAMAVATEDGVLVRVNAALADLLGATAPALLGRRLQDLVWPASTSGSPADSGWPAAPDVAPYVVRGQLRRADGRLVHVLVGCAHVPAVQHGPAYLVVHVQDTSAQHDADVELTHRSLHDPLTGLPNRVLMLDRIQHALARLVREPASVAVLFVDLDDFKTVNDTHGHTVGDQVLVALAHRLQALQRPGDTVCRYGGDEFVVLCEDSGDSQARSVAARIHHALSTPISWVNPQPAGTTAGTLRLAASIGIATTCDPATTGAQLIDQADRTMYRAKHHHTRT